MRSLFSRCFSSPLADAFDDSPAFRLKALSLCQKASRYSIQESCSSSAGSTLQQSSAPSYTLLATSCKFSAEYGSRRWSMQDFDIIQVLHEGYAAIVYQAFCNVTLELVAVKLYKLRNMRFDELQQIYREVEIHSKMSHPNVISLHVAFQDQGNLVLVTEYATAGDLFGILGKHHGVLTEHLAVKKVLAPLLEALVSIHEQGVVHRDIKPKNILFTSDGCLKLTDFGIAFHMNDGCPNIRVGTPGYMAPEVLKCPRRGPLSTSGSAANNSFASPSNSSHTSRTSRLWASWTSIHSSGPSRSTPGGSLIPRYGLPVDCWSVGVLAYQLITGYLPFEHPSKTFEDLPPLKWPENVHHSDLAHSFVELALKLRPADRGTMNELLHHPWITQYRLEPRQSLDVITPDMIAETGTPRSSNRSSRHSKAPGTLTH